MIESMKNASNKTIWIILLIVLFFLLSCVSKQKVKTELRDAEFYFNRGVTSYKKGQLDQAISDYTNALEINPRLAEAYYRRGIAYVKKGQLDQAISDFTKAFEINPRYAEAYYSRGVAYYFKREYGKSWKDVEKAQSLGHQIDPKFLDKLRRASGRQN